LYDSAPRLKQLVRQPAAESGKTLAIFFVVVKTPDLCGLKQRFLSGVQRRADFFARTVWESFAST
jgi:hypothetical protein